MGRHFSKVGATVILGPSNKEVRVPRPPRPPVPTPMFSDVEANDRAVARLSCIASSMCYTSRALLKMQVPASRAANCTHSCQSPTHACPRRTAPRRAVLYIGCGHSCTRSGTVQVRKIKRTLRPPTSVNSNVVNNWTVDWCLITTLSVQNRLGLYRALRV